MSAGSILGLPTLVRCTNRPLRPNGLASTICRSPTPARASARPPYTASMRFAGEHLVALLLTISFAAGLNLYATLATLGLLAHAGLFVLPAPLHMIENWYVIAASSAMFTIEFFADKIPALDLVWNALHTFIRIPVAALLVYKSTAMLPPWEQAAAAAAGGLIALAAHGGKTAARAAVTPSPEPVSNIALSIGEDFAAIFLTWLATFNPYLAAAIVVVIAIAGILLLRWFGTLSNRCCTAFGTASPDSAHASSDPIRQVS